MLATLSAEDFTPHIGQPFEVGTPEQPLRLELISVTASRGTPAAARAGFSLLFGGAPAPRLPQGMYPVAHPALGALDIFLVPVGPGAQGMQYEAIFN